MSKIKIKTWGRSDHDISYPIWTVDFRTRLFFKFYICSLIKNGGTNKDLKNIWNKRENSTNGIKKWSIIWKGGSGLQLR